MSFLYVGNRRGRPSSWDTPPPPNLGIAIYAFRDEDAHMALVGHVGPDISVGALCVDASRHVLYCTNETMTPPGQAKGGGGEVCSFSINPLNGQLTLLSRQPSYGSLPAYLTLSADGRYLIAVNHTGHTPATRVRRTPEGGFAIERQYDDATTVLYRLHPDGSIGQPCDIHWHTGKGGSLPQQTHSQLHAVVRSPSGQWFVVCDKGSDEVVLFSIDAQADRLKLCPGSPQASVPGSSPRYCAFHPSRPYFYVNHETAPLISVFHYDGSGQAQCVAQTSICAQDETPQTPLMQSDLLMHPSGKVLYDLVRGSNEVRVFEPTATGERLSLVQVVPIAGQGPRGCALSPDGRHLLVAALLSQQVLAFAIDDRGHLQATGQASHQPHPGHLCFYPPGNQADPVSEPSK